ncbi:alpha/beta hydrolase [Candidatus Pantoea multigeneris]|uniref:Alpha/beta hydrolase n=1 Tax=Candidatus Pantoea multigeneris TaxID=2608357 RepID=A0ABX0R816_9GAMM|nr:alpha/beta hydrolase [Pantoea multigeneris]NIF21486.1 alpha/beta hydrolase [Pantoea multigeneris]
MKNRIFALGVVLSLSVATAACAMMPDAMPHGGPTIKEKQLKPAFADVAYSDKSKTQKLDVYLPTGHTAPYPVVIYAHPGGFKFGDKTMAPYSIVHAILDKGYAFVSVDYRLSGESHYPAAVQDFFTATEFVQSHASEYHLNSGKIYYYGESAGANIVALAGLAADNPVFNQEKLHPATFIKPAGVISLYPPVDFARIVEFTQAQGCSGGMHFPGLNFEEQYLGGKLADNVDKIHAANPVTYVKAGAPAFFIENGSNDCNVGSEQSKLLVNALTKAGVPVFYHEFPGAGHGGPEFETQENVKKLTDFLK